MASVFVLLEAPMVWTCTVTESPGVTSVVMTTLICHKPTSPGVNPEKTTSADLPPMSTTGLVWVVANGDPGAASPLFGVFASGPGPVAKICMISPALAGLAGVFRELSLFRIAPWVRPFSVAVKIPGADAANAMVAGALEAEPDCTTTG